MSTKRFSIGERITERYSVRDIKSGGLCLTYFCHDESFDMPVVIKTPRYETFGEWQYSRNDFIQGAKKWILVGRELGIAQAYSLFAVSDADIGDIPCLAVEFVRGDRRAGASLYGWIRDPRSDLKLILYFSHAFCSSMIKLRKKLDRPGVDFTHLNLKPENILITHEGTLKITDIGLTQAVYKNAIRHNCAEASLSPNHNPKQCRPKNPLPIRPRYASPEQCMSIETIDARSDIYSFGCILYEMCARRHMFEGCSEAEYISKHVEKIPVSPRKWNPGLPGTLERLILGCLAKNPAERPSDFGEVREIIGEIIKSQGIPSGIRFWLFGFSAFTRTPRVKSDMRMDREDEAIILEKVFGVQYVIDQGLVRDREELEVIRAQKGKANSAEERAESQRKSQVEDLVRVGDIFLEMAEKSEGREAEKSARSAISKYISAHELLPRNPQIGFRIAMACRMLAGIIWEVNEGLSDELLNLAIKKYDEILEEQKEPDPAIIGGSYYLLPFHALFQRGTIHAARGQFVEAVNDMEQLSIWIKQADKSRFTSLFESLDKEISTALDLLKEDAE